MATQSLIKRLPPEFSRYLGADAKAELAANPALLPQIQEAAQTDPELRLDLAFALSGTPRFHTWLTQNCPDHSWDWTYLRHIQHQLDRITLGEIDRLMLFVPPRHGKSTMVTERYTVYYMQQAPGARVIVGSYGQNLANKFSRHSRRIAREINLTTGQQMVMEWEVHGGGAYKAVGVGTDCTGFGGDLLILDDPIKDREQANSPVYREKVWDWYQDVFSSRLEPGGKMIIILTRWHEDDLAGRLLREHPDEWPNVIEFPALALGPGDALGRSEGDPLCPQRYNKRALERIQRNVPESTWWSLYQQKPRPAGGAVYLRKWWDDHDHARYDYRDPGPRNACIARFISWDTAFKDNPEADYTACTVFELSPDYRAYVREVYWAHLKYPDLIDVITGFALKYNFDNKLHSVIIEDRASGISALQDLQKNAPGWLRPLIRGFKVDSSKVERAQEAAIRCRAGSVLLPLPNEDVPWLLEFEQELFSFPSSVRKDRVDSFTQGVLCLEDLLILGERGRTYGAA